VTPIAIQPPKSSGPFGLDPDVIADIEKDWVRVDQMEQVEVKRVDISLLYEPIRILPTKDGFKYPQEKFEQLLARSRSMQHTHTSPQSAGASPYSGGGGGATVSSPYISPRQQEAQAQNQYIHSSK